MKLSFNRTDFLGAARRLCKVAPETNPVQALTGILLEADADNLEVTLTATNLETIIICNLSAAVYESGSAIVNAVLFTEMLRRFGEATVSVEQQTNGQLSLTCGSAAFIVGTLPSDDFPNIPVTKPEYVGEVVGLPALVKSTAFLVSKGSDGDPKHCVRMDFKGKSARAVSTDGTRLMSCKKSLPTENKPLTLLIPVTAFTLLASLVENDETLRLKSSTKQVTFKTEQMTFTTRLGIGSYIDVDSVLSSVAGCYEALVEAKALQDATNMMDAIAVAGDQLNMVFRLDGIALQSNSERAQSKSHAIAQVTTPMPPEGFYYPLRNFYQGISTMSGMLKLSVTIAGFLLAEGDGQTYFQTPVRYKEKTLKRPEKSKDEAAEKPAKKSKTTKKAAKAA